MLRKPNLIGTSPYFAVADLEAAARHYESVLGFRREYAEGRPPRLVILRRDGVAVMLRRVADRALAPNHNRKQAGMWDAFFWASDVQSLYEELCANGADVVYGPTVQREYHMKEFAVRDPDGYVLGFGQQWH